MHSDRNKESYYQYTKNMKIADIAHDGKKAEMVAFLNRHMDFLKSVGIEIVATGTTGKHAQDSGLEVERLLSGPLGGDAQIAALVAEHKVGMVIFFRDPLGKYPVFTGTRRWIDQDGRRPDGIAGTV